MKNLLTMLFTVALLCGCGESDKTKFQIETEAWENENANKERLESEAQQKLLECITNDVVGLSKIIDFQIPYLDPKLTNGQARANVEFVNKIGGVEREVRYYKVWKFQVSSKEHVGVMRDYSR